MEIGLEMSQIRLYRMHAQTRGVIQPKTELVARTLTEMGGLIQLQIGQFTQQEKRMHSLKTQHNGETVTETDLEITPREITLTNAQVNTEPPRLTELDVQMPMGTVGQMQEIHSQQMAHNGKTETVTITEIIQMETTLMLSLTIRANGQILMATAMVTGLFFQMVTSSRTTPLNGAILILTDLEITLMATMEISVLNFMENLLFLQLEDVLILIEMVS